SGAVVAAGFAGAGVGAAAAGAVVAAGAAGADVGAAAGGALGAHAASTPMPTPNPVKPNAVSSCRRLKRNLEMLDESLTGRPLPVGNHSMNRCDRCQSNGPR